MAETHEVTDTNVMGDINVTPLVDVMLVLLIIFMIVTPALVGGFHAELPRGANLKEKPHDENRTTLGIAADGQYFLNKQPISKEEAFVRLRSEFARHPEDRVLFLRADAGLKYGVLMEAMNTAKLAGARVVAAVTEANTQSERQEEQPGGRN